MHGERTAEDSSPAATAANGGSDGTQRQPAPADAAAWSQSADEEVSVRRDDAAQRIAEESSLATVAQVEADDTMRSDAVHRLRFAVSPEAVPALGRVLASDASPRVRYEALESLRTLFVNDMDPDGTIQQIIQAAEYDADPRVAAHAREISREIRELLTPVDTD
jgi:hypothetical protein